MNNIGPGDLVQCVDDDWEMAEPCQGETFPIRGHVYTVRALQRGRDVNRPCDYLLLKEIRNPPRRMGKEVHFWSVNFVPIDHRPEFTEWLESLPEREKVDG